MNWRTNRKSTNGRLVNLVRIPLGAGWLAAVLATTPMVRADDEADEEQPIAISQLEREAPVDFEREILPLLRQNCLACHSRARAESELVLETPQTIRAGGAQGPAVVPGDSGESLLLQVASRQSEPFMPPADNTAGARPFTPDELGLIKLWIDQGAKGEVRGSADAIAWQPLPPGVNPILAVATSDDGRYAACGRANQIFVYHLPSKQLVGRLTDPALIDGQLYTQPGVAHHDLVQSLAFSPDGFTLASGGYREIKLWRRPANVIASEAPTGAGAITASASSADGRWLALAGHDAAIRLWDTSSNQPGPVLTGHTAEVAAICISADGARAWSAGRDRTIRVWDLASAQQVAKIDTPVQVLSLACIDGAEQLATGGEDGLVRLWKPSTDPAREIAAVTAAPTAWARSADGQRAAIGLTDGAVQIVDLASGEVVAVTTGLDAPVAAVAISADGRWLAAAAGAQVRICDAASGDAIAGFQVQSSAAARLAFAAGKRRLAVGEFDGSVSLWDVDVEAKTASPGERSSAQGQPITGLAFSPDGARLFAAAADGSLQAFSESLNTPAYEVRMPGPVSALGVSADGRWLAVAGPDGVVRVWQAADGAASSGPAATSAGASIEQLDFSPDGRRLAAVLQDHRVAVYDFQAEPAAAVFLAEIVSPAAGPVAGAAIVGDALAAVSADRQLRAHPLRSLAALTGHTQPVRALARSSTGALYSGGDDGAVRQWDLEQRTSTRTLELGGPVTAIAVRGDGKRLAAAGQHGVARLWQTDDGAQIAEIQGDAPARARVAKLTEELAIYKQKVEGLTAAVAAADKDLTDKLAASQAAVDALPAAEAAAQEATTKSDAAAQAKTEADKLAADTAAKAEAATKAKADADKLAADTAQGVAAAAEAAGKAQAALDAQNQASEALVALAQAAKSALEKQPDDADLAAAVAAADKAVASATPALEAATGLQTMLAKLRDDRDAASRSAVESQAAAEQALTEAQTAAQSAAEAKTAAEKAAADAAAAAKTANDAHDAAKRSVAETKRGVEAATAALPLAKTNLELASATQAEFDARLAAANESAAAHEKPLRSLAFSADGALLAIGGDDGVVRTYNAETGQPYEAYARDAGPVGATAFGAAGRLLSVSADGLLSAWELYPAWNLQRVLGPSAEGDESAADPAASPLADRVVALAFSPDGRLLASGGGEPSRSGEIVIWDLSAAQPALVLDEPHSDTVYGLQFSSDGRYLASASADKFVKVFDVADGKLLRSYEGHTHHALAAAWRFDGRQLASGGADGVVKIWNFDSGEQERTIRGFDKEVTSIAYLGTGGLVLTSAGDRVVRLQNADDGKGVRNFGGAADFIYSARATPDGAIVVAGGQDSVLRVWNGADGKSIVELAPPENAPQ